MPCDTDGSTAPAEVDFRVRRQPVQARSEARIQQILDATAAIVARAGLEAVTTTLVASDAGMSVGALYRYFPDRQGLILALARRNRERFLRMVDDALDGDHVVTWVDALDVAFDVALRMYAEEPGFARLRFGGWIKEQLLGGSSPADRPLADIFATIFVERFGVEADPDLSFHIQIATDIVDVLLTRAFADGAGAGDQKVISECRRIVHGHLQAQIDPVEHTELSAASGD